MSTSDSFGELVCRVRRGDQAALTELLVRSRPCLDRVCQDVFERSAPDLSTADVLQEVWIRVWSRLDQFRGAEDRQQTEAMYLAWLRRTARSAALNLLASRDALKRHPPGHVVRLDARIDGDSSDCDQVAVPAGDPTPSENAMADEEAQRMNAALGELSEVQRTIIQLRFFQCVSLREIAKQLELSYDQVRELFATSLEQLRQQLAKGSDHT